MMGIPRYQFAARSCGGAAGRGVSELGAGRVAAVFQRSFYIEAPSGALVCIGPLGMGPGPLNLLCEFPSDVDWPSLGLRQEMLVRREGDALRIGETIGIPLAGIVEWHPPSRQAHSLASLAAGLSMLAGIVQGRTEIPVFARNSVGMETGFMRLVPALAKGAFAEAKKPTPRDPLLRLAWPGITALADWLGAPRRAVPVDALDGLLGLGPGLTPSGDDFLGGALVALAALGRRDVAARLAAALLPRVAQRTNAISAAHLACAAAGEGAGALHDFLIALSTANASDIEASVAALGSIGHSSGWDMMAGAALTCRALVGRSLTGRGGGG
jgi:hypothetical protein